MTLYCRPILYSAVPYFTASTRHVYGRRAFVVVGRARPQGTVFRILALMPTSLFSLCLLKTFLFPPYSAVRTKQFLLISACVLHGMTVTLFCLQYLPAMLEVKAKKQKPKDLYSARSRILLLQLRCATQREPA